MTTSASPYLHALKEVKSQKLPICSNKEGRRRRKGRVHVNRPVASQVSDGCNSANADLSLLCPQLLLKHRNELLDLDELCCGLGVAREVGKDSCQGMVARLDLRDEQQSCQIALLQRPGSRDIHRHW